MHIFLVRSLNQQGFLIKDLKILSVPARDLTRKSAARPAGPIHASCFFPVRMRHLITTKVTEKGKSSVTQSWFWQRQFWQRFLKAERFASRRQNHGRQHCCNIAILTGWSKQVLVPLELAQFFFLCQWYIIFAWERQSYSLSDFISKNN